MSLRLVGPIMVILGLRTRQNYAQFLLVVLVQVVLMVEDLQEAIMAEHQEVPMVDHQEVPMVDHQEVIMVDHQEVQTVDRQEDRIMEEIY